MCDNVGLGFWTMVGQGTTVRPCLLVQTFAETTVVWWKARPNEQAGALSLKRDCLPKISVRFWVVGHHGIRFPRLVITDSCYILTSAMFPRSYRGCSNFQQCLQVGRISHCDLLWGIPHPHPLHLIFCDVVKGACRMRPALIELASLVKDCPFHSTIVYSLA